MQIRYHLDESVAHAIGHGLRQRGIDVTTATEAGLIGATDEQHLEYGVYRQPEPHPRDATVA